MNHDDPQDTGIPVVQGVSVEVLRVYGAALVLPGLLFGVMSFNLAGFWAADGSEGLPMRLTWGAIGHLVGAAIAGTLSLIGERRAGEGHGFGPRQAATVPVRGGDDLPYRIKVALLGLRAEIRRADADAGIYVAETLRTWNGPGERVTVELSGDAAHPQARVTSRPLSRGQLLDSGRGRSNVNRVIEALQE
ncbi:hypothetical protein [Blastococcus sp. LR1]|uniref:hypothetical protein n=1 Tax=Blastococcus sp. LR1 TaxID=2877000 RepID=UPI001CCE2BDB|nr:hypothetical protein [Blastococcus sp. LR1]MCA0145881.1 hypothetical protein [Blastococcus sp. LR1]